jgi:hypothetical protein
MTARAVDLDEIDPHAALTLAVGWKSGQKTKLRQITIGGDVETAFREVISGTLDNLRDREATPWSPDADLSPETFLVIHDRRSGVRAGPCCGAQ